MSLSHDSSQQPAGPTPPAPPGDPPNRAGCLSAAVVVFAVGNLLQPALAAGAGSPIFEPLASTVVLLQFGLLGLWAALGPQRLWVRMLAVWSLAFWLGGTLILAFVVRSGPHGAGLGWFVPILLLPILVSASQLPLTIARWLRGWRLIPNELAGDSREATRQFSLADILTVTTLVAVALALAKVAVKIEEVAGGERVFEPYEAVLLLLLVYGVLLAAWSTLATLPGIWAVFIARDKSRGARWFAIYVLIVWASLVAVILVISRITSDNPIKPIVVMSVFVVGSGVLTLLALHGIRLAGYKLDRPLRRQPRSPRGETPAPENRAASSPL